MGTDISLYTLYDNLHVCTQVELIVKRQNLLYTNIYKGDKLKLNLEYDKTVKQAKIDHIYDVEFQQCPGLIG